MDGQKSGALALIAGSLLVVMVFALHPTHVGGAPILGPFTLSQFVHGAALVGAPVLAFGMWQMADWLDWRRVVTKAALLLAALAMVLTVNAAVVSNFVTPAAARASMPAAGPQMVHPGPAAHPPSAMRIQMPPLVATSVALNRGLAQVHVAYLSLALLLFGAALLGRSRLLGWSGVLVGAYPVIWQLSGRFSPETTTMPWIAFPQAAWLIAVAVAMLRTSRSAA